MKIENIVLVGLLVLVVGGLIYSLTGFGFLKANNIGIKSASKVESRVEQPSQLQSNSEKKSSEGSVTIDITPSEFKDGKMYFDIGVNTHSVTLTDYDLVQLTTLEFEGKSIKPISAPKLTGHHNSGTLVFETGKELKNFKIKVKGIPDIEERVFEWP